MEIYPDTLQDAIVGDDREGSVVTVTLRKETPDQGEGGQDHGSRARVTFERIQIPIKEAQQGQRKVRLELRLAVKSKRRPIKVALYGRECPRFPKLTTANDNPVK